MTALIVPLPQVPVSVRPATPADFPFIDSLQKKHSRMVGFMPAKQIEGKIAAGHVLVAEETRGQGEEVTRGGGTSDASPCPLVPVSPCLPERLGYCIATDRYFKRDDVGIIYQLNVAPGRQRSFIG